MDVMADDPYVRIKELEAEVARLRDRESELGSEVERLRPLLSEALEQQTATAEVMRVIASSPRDLDSVMQALVESINQLRRADGVTLNQVEGDSARLLWDQRGPDQESARRDGRHLENGKMAWTSWRRARARTR
jgi:hypothetical protein